MPSRERAAMRVVFLPRLRGTFPLARSPFGARAYMGVKAILEPHSSIKTNDSVGSWFAFSRQAARSSSFRSVAPNDFFDLVQPSRLIARLMGKLLTRLPCACSHIAQCCESRASSCICSWGSTLASTCARFFEGRPGIVLGRTCPCSRRCFTYRHARGERNAKYLDNLSPWIAVVHSSQNMFT